MSVEGVDFVTLIGDAWTEEAAGLVEDCLICQEARVKVKELERCAGNVEIVGEIRIWDKQEWRSTVGNIAHGMRITCEHCHNTGKRLSAKGKRVMQFIQKWMADFPPAAPTEEEKEEIF